MHISPALAKLKAVVKTVPRLSQFVEKTCAFVFGKALALRSLVPP